MVETITVSVFLFWMSCSTAMMDDCQVYAEEQFVADNWIVAKEECDKYKPVYLEKRGQRFPTPHNAIFCE